jgi:hypothetical protein
VAESDECEWRFTRALIAATQINRSFVLSEKKTKNETKRAMGEASAHNNVACGEHQKALA